jgi:hypothetical protein
MPCYGSNQKETRPCMLTWTQVNFGKVRTESRKNQEPFMSGTTRSGHQSKLILRVKELLNQVPKSQHQVLWTCFCSLSFPLQFEYYMEPKALKKKKSLLFLNVQITDFSMFVGTCVWEWNHGFQTMSKQLMEGKRPCWTGLCTLMSLPCIHITIESSTFLLSILGLCVHIFGVFWGVCGGGGGQW